MYISTSYIAHRYIAPKYIAPRYIVLRSIASRYISSMYLAPRCIGPGPGTRIKNETMTFDMNKNPKNCIDIFFFEIAIIQ